MKALIRTMRLPIVSMLALAITHYAYAEQGLESLPDYSKVPGISGSLLSVGSDTLAGMTTLWVEEFKSYYPNVNAQVQASGSSTAPPALTEGTAHLGPMSRPMRLREVEAFEREHGYKPTALRVAIDAIGLFVHRDNPVEGLNFRQIDGIFPKHYAVVQQNHSIVGKISILTSLGLNIDSNCLDEIRFQGHTAISSKMLCAVVILRIE